MNLSGAFQVALGILATNSRTTRRLLQGDLHPRELTDGLTDEDIAGLQSLKVAYGDRLLVVADMLTTRRRRKILALLPATVHILGGRFGACWLEYLGTSAPPGAPSPAAEAAAFSAWLLAREHWGPIESQLMRFELCMNDVLERNQASHECPARQDSLLPADCRLRLSSLVRVEQFDSAVDDCMSNFRRTGKIATPSGPPVCLIFHPAGNRRGGVAVTKIAAAMRIVLGCANSTVTLQDLLKVTPAAWQPGMREALQRLAHAGVLEILA